MTFQNIDGITPAPLATRHQSSFPFHAPATGGIYGWMTPAIAAIANENTFFAARAFALSRSERHRIGLLTALMGNKANDPDHLRAFARAYENVTLKELLALADPQADPGLLRLVPRLSGSTWRANTYRRLAYLYDEPESQKTLRHLASIDRRHVLNLGRLPQGYRNASVLRLARKQSYVVQVAYAVKLVDAMRPQLGAEKISASLATTSIKKLRSWVLKHAQKTPFPPAPVSALVIDGVEAIRPLSTYKDLKRAALEFDNCVRSYHYSVLQGTKYFYRFAPEAGGKGVAVIELRKTPTIGWVVEEALGPDNASITAVHRASILAAFREAGIIAAPQASHDVWFDLE